MPSLPRRAFLTGLSLPLLALAAGCVVERPRPPGPAPAAVEIIAPRPPPAARYEVVPPPPAGRGEVVVWERGHWQWDGHDWDWVPGHFVERPHRTAEWVEGHWAERPNGTWAWVPGHWR
jgi:YXWGXW repeat-containing protein